MAVTYPLALGEFFDIFKFASFSMDLNENQNMSGLASGSPIFSNTMPMLWAGNASSILMPNQEAQEIASKLRLLSGSKAIYLCDIRMQYPKSDPNGSVMGGATPVISSIGANNKSFSISGLPSAYEVSAGDRFSYVYNTSRVFYGEFSETKTAVSGSITSIEVRPHLRPGMVAGGEITLIKPALKAVLVGENPKVKVNREGGLHSSISFSFQQTLASD